MTAGTTRAGACPALVALLVVMAGCATAERPGAAQPSTPAPTPRALEEWDPRDADALPSVDALVVDPPPDAPSLASEPLSAAVMVIDKDEPSRSVDLLGVDGSWRRVPHDKSSYAGVDLSTDGTRLAVETTDPVGVDVWDLATGKRRHLDPPAGYQPWEYTGWSWVDGRTLLVNDAVGGWLVDARTGSAERVGYPRRQLAWDLDASGALVQSADFTDPSVLTDWAGGRPRDIDKSAVGRFTSLAVDAEIVVGATYENGPFKVVAVSRRDASPLFELAIRDPKAEYGNGGLQVVEMLDDGRAVLQVRSYSRAPRERTWQLVAWDPGTGELSLLARSAGVVGGPLSLAEDLLG